MTFRGQLAVSKIPHDLGFQILWSPNSANIIVFMWVPRASRSTQGQRFKCKVGITKGSTVLEMQLKINKENNKNTQGDCVFPLICLTKLWPLLEETPTTMMVICWENNAASKTGIGDIHMGSISDFCSHCPC